MLTFRFPNGSSSFFYMLLAFYYFVLFTTSDKDDSLLGYEVLKVLIGKERRVGFRRMEPMTTLGWSPAGLHRRLLILLQILKNT